MVNSSLDIGAFLLGVGGSVVTTLKILNVNYGAGILIAFISNRVEGNTFLITIGYIIKSLEKTEEKNWESIGQKKQSLMNHRIPPAASKNKMMK